MTKKLPKDKLLPKLTLKFFTMPRLTAVLWIALTVFGLICYTTLLRREGFPSVNIPIAIVNGVYPVSDPAKVDAEVTKPLSDIAQKQAGVTKVLSQSSDNFFNVVIQYKEGTDAAASTKAIEEAVRASGTLPATARPEYNVPTFGVTGGDTQKIDVAVSFYAKNSDTPTAEIVTKAQQFSESLKAYNLSFVQSYGIKNPLSNITTPDGSTINIQRSFDRYGVRQGDDTTFYPSVLITVAAIDDVDVIKLDKQVRDAVEQEIKKDTYQGYGADISASFGPQIVENISELQKVLLEGLVAVLVIGTLVIALRASFITILSMVTVILSTIGLLYLLGYTLNVITLFGLILGLSLIVDDTIIMVEALEASRRKTKTAKEAVMMATRKVSRAMVAATTTAALCFVPLALVGGVLGSFIRAIPVTIISSLIISLFVALVFIPFFSKFLLLGKNQLGKQAKPGIGSAIESRIAGTIVKPMLWARNSRKRLVGVGLAAVIFGFTFIGAGMGLAQKVTFNIFPPTKDTNGLIVTLNFPQGTDIVEAQKLAGNAERLSAEAVGDEFVRASYYSLGNPQTAMFQIELTPYGERDITSPQLVEQVKAKLNSELKGATASVSQVDMGPPTAAFSVQIKGEDRAAGYRLANDLRTFLATSELKRLDGSIARFTDITISSADTFIRSDGTPIIQLNSGFNGTDTTTLVTLAQDAINKEFTESKLASYGLAKDAIGYDLGQESENQDSFKTLAITFPILLIVIFLLLVLEFRSFLQPLLIFMAIPFSIFGVMLGLFLTDNAISFFAMLGFFALIGLSIKNTILLTDFANQSREAGLSAVDSAAAAIAERFRPLVATSLTAIFSLIPLAITSPFWQGLAVVLIFGLASSTLLVLLVFPYFYLGVEFLRMHISRKKGLIWLAGTIAIAYVIGRFINPGIVPLVLLASFAYIISMAFRNPGNRKKQA